MACNHNTLKEKKKNLTQITHIKLEENYPYHRINNGPYKRRKFLRGINPTHNQGERITKRKLKAKKNTKFQWKKTKIKIPI